MKKLIKIIFIIIFVGFIYLIYNMLSIAPRGTKAYSTYSFAMSKYYLEDKMDSLVKFDEKIFRNKLSNNSTEKFYNTGRYFTIYIDSTEFVFRFKGDSSDWLATKDSIKIFLTSINSSKKDKQSEEEMLEIVQKQFINKLIE